jgi:hypothetical protein
MQAAPDFDIALSFAGEHRVYVAEVARLLKSRGYRVFYDDFERADLLGQDLISYLQEVYSHRSTTVAAFISQEWATKPWTGHERQTALAHALLHASNELPFLLPLRFDDTPVPGLQTSVGYDDLRELRVGERKWRQDPRYKHPHHVADLLAAVLTRRGVSPRDEGFDASEWGVRSLLTWIRGRESGSHVGLVPQDEFDLGETEVFPGEVRPNGPPPGRYLLLPDRIGVGINPKDGYPVFLLEGYRTYEKEWIIPLDDPSEEAAVADRAFRRVRDLVEEEIAEGAVSLGPTFTQTAQTPFGTAVYGRCVVARKSTE